MKINQNRLMSFLKEVNHITEPGFGITRLAYSEKEEEALDWFIRKCTDHSIRTYRDAIGNVFGTIGPRSENGILIGSHLDTVKNGGEYDGALGVLAGLEVLITLLEEGTPLSRPLTVVSFRGEEANILGGTFGSRAFCGNINFNDEFLSRLESTPFSVQQVKDAVGYDIYNDYLELHIEQGRKLESSKKSIGIVNAIAGIKRLDFTVLGEAAHSGTMGMVERDDALIHTAKILLEIEEIIRSYGEPYVATVGEIHVEPNLPNVVPGEVNFTLEVRGEDIKKMRKITVEIISYADSHHKILYKDNVEKLPSILSEKLVEKIELACESSGISYHRMMSGANHDASSLSDVMNSGLLFIPCLNGVSHNPKEYAAAEDIEKGSNVLLSTILELLD